MAWGAKKVEEQRQLFIKSYQDDGLSMAELCRHFEISRKNGYKWLKRYLEEGMDGLKDKSRIRLTQSAATEPLLLEKILSTRIRYPTWGPRKVLAYLELEHPFEKWPCPATIGNLFDKHGLTVARKYRKRLPIKNAPLSHCKEINDVWCVDFKGYFLTKDGKQCDPLTITDAHSRYLLRCLKLKANNTEQVWGIFDAAFREYGLPSFVRSDNGPPFATCGAGRLSPLAVRLIKAGVVPEWIEPGEPQQNGRHERMHLTLKQEATFPLILTLEEQQLKFHEFQEYYNFTRPHEALNNMRPGDVYLPSNRSWSGKLHSPEYSKEYKVGWVKSCGKMSWKGDEIYISRSLAEEPIGLIEDGEGKLMAYYGPIKLGEMTKEKTLEISRRPGRKKRQEKTRK